MNTTEMEEKAVDIIFLSVNGNFCDYSRETANPALSLTEDLKLTKKRDLVILAQNLSYFFKIDFEYRKIVKCDTIRDIFDIIAENVVLTEDEPQWNSPQDFEVSKGANPMDFEVKAVNKSANEEEAEIYEEQLADFLNNGFPRT